MRNHRLRVFASLLVAGTVAAGTLAAASGAYASVSTTSDAMAIGQAMMRDTSKLVGAAFVARPTVGTPTGTDNEALSAFPTAGTTYGILSTGDAHLWKQCCNVSNDAGYDLRGPNVRGNSDFDVTILRLDLNLPTGTTCLSFDVQMQTEEYGGSKTINKDAFIAEMNTSTWTTNNEVISAPNNFAFDTEHGALNASSTGVLAVGRGSSVGEYDGATPVLRAASLVPVGDANGTLPGTDSVYLSVFDQVDRRLDTAAVIDDIATTSTLTTAQCKEGLKPPPLLTYAGPGSAYWGEPVAYTLTLTDALTLAPIVGHALVLSSGTVSNNHVTDSAGKASGTITIPKGATGLLATYPIMFLYPRTSQRFLWVERHETTLTAEPVLLKGAPVAVTAPDLRATLTDTHSAVAVPIAGALVFFQASSPDRAVVADFWCIATTDASGTAVCPGKSLDPSVLLTRGYDVSYFGSGSYEYADAHGPLARVQGNDLPA